MTEVIYKMLDDALDYGITEDQFWDMTIPEIQRAVDSSIRVNKIKSKEKAYFDYVLATLISKGVSKTLGGKSDFPSIEKAYPEIFNVSEEQKAKIQEQKMNLSALRFKMFAQSYNSKFKEVAKENE